MLYEETRARLNVIGSVLELDKATVLALLARVRSCPEPIDKISLKLVERTDDVKLVKLEEVKPTHIRPK